MAVVTSSQSDIAVQGPGGIRMKTAVLTLVSGECSFAHGFRTVTCAIATPVAASSAVAVQTLTITGLTIPSQGWPSSSDGTITVKSNEGASTIQVFVLVMGF